MGQVNKRAIAAGVIFLLLVPVLVDFVQWSLWRQALQRRADAAALAGAIAVRFGNPPIPAVRGRLARQLFADPPAIEHPPSDGPYAGRTDAVRVSLSTNRSPFFHSRLFGASPMRAKATAATVAYRDGSTIVLRVE